MEKQEIYVLCEKHRHRYVCVQMKDGAMYDGIVEDVDDEHLYLAVPLGGMEAEPVRAFGPYFGGVPFYGYPPYPYFGFPRRRFARQVLPLAGLLALSLLPYY